MCNSLLHKITESVQGYTEQCESVQGHTEQTKDRFQECVQGHNVDNKIPVSVSMSNPNPHMHMQLPPPLLQQVPSDQTITTLQNMPASGQASLVQSMTELLKAQTQMLAAQAQAASVQGLPALTPFTGEESQSQLFDEDFDHWLKSFEERAFVARWTAEQKLCQLKAHLNKTALQMFRLLSEDERSTYDKAVQALRKRFKPIDIEELRGIEFNQKMQQDESIEQLGIELQNLGRKAFPQMNEKELDRLLKGRFFQALNSKWQRKLAAPKPNETFNELYDRARTLEKHEKQISATAAIKSDAKSSSDRSKQPQGANKSSTTFKNQKSLRDQAPPPTTVTRGFRSNRPTGAGSQRGQAYSQPYRGGCFLCGGPHLARTCPDRGASAEAPGRSSRSNQSRSAQVTATPTTVVYTEEELMKMLSECRLKKEEEALLVQDGSQCSTISTKEQTSDAVGPTLRLQLHIEGVPVEAMVDTGSQSTVISRAVLHEVGRHLRHQGREMPQLRLPSARLYGKDCEGEKRELDITAEVSLKIEAEGKAVTAPVFVQPESEQPCLLGMNIAPALGLKFLDANGLPLKEYNSHSRQCQERTSAVVCLTQTSTLPGRKGRFLEAKVDPTIQPGTEIIFEPSAESLRTLGLSAQESLLCVQKDSTVLIPVQNFKQNTVDIQAGFELGGVETLQTKFHVQPSNCSLDMPEEVKCSQVTTRRQAKL